MDRYRRNIPLFIAFRVFFNARFYYPVLGVLFIDLGLTLEQYVILNTVWAVTIILLEIPSGAMADWIGRRTMVVVAGCLMILEMAILAFAPAGPLLFWFLVFNRILSGAAEASASGADEALAYDSLPPGDRTTEWQRVLSRLVRWSSGAFFVAMVVGGAVFDAGLVTRVATAFGFAGEWSPADTVRWPIYLTLATAVMATGCALAMRDVPRESGKAARRARAVLDNIVGAATFVFSRRAVVLLLLAGVLFDSTIRLFLTLASNYYRLIQLPPAANGLLGSVFALLGIAAAGMAPALARRLPPMGVAFVLGLTLTVALFGISLATPIWGAWAVVPLGLVMPMVGYFLSNYLNAWTGSELRATVLSFRGVALNIGYGLAGIGFAAITSSLRAQAPELDENALLARTLYVLPAAFLAGAVVLVLFSATPLSGGGRRQ
ncbi:MAG: MFS transporter [Terrimicrobiaceae bacterium]|nr:MFS transporter [Terrimicrobiaceae bacterium]